MSEPDKAKAMQDARARIGTTLAERFRLDEVLGLGAMGVVYKAHHTGLRKDVALKLLRRELTANDEMLARFDREATAASRLDHPNCVRVMDFGSTGDGLRFLVMEHLEGQDLAELADGAFPPFRVVGLMLQVLSGLEHAHQQGLVHRDIKPENIFVTDGGSGEHVKLLDFGIAKVKHGAGASQLTRAGMIFGTPHYMSPEQARGGPIDARGDLYSLGVVMYALLSGKLPFDGDDPVAVLRMHLNEPVPALPTEIPGSLRHFVDRLLAKDPGDRFPDAGAAIAALRRAAAPTDPAPAVASPTAAESTAGTVEIDGAELEPAQSVSAEVPPVTGARSGSTLQVQSEGEAPTAASSGSRPRPRWVLPAAAIGVLGLVGVLAVRASSGDPEPTPSPLAAASETPPPPPAEVEAAAEPEPADEVVVVDDDEAAPAEPAASKADLSRRALRANIESIDALIDARKNDAARITIEPLLKVYPGEPALQWRMGRVLYALNARKNAGPALERYREALRVDAALLHNEEFSDELWPLVDNPRLRVLASELAVELLGEAAHDRLVAWVNVQSAPLPYPQRHAALDHLRANEQTERINVPLQTALDLWQSTQADDPCAAFGKALDLARDDSDSFLAGTLAAVSVPSLSEDVPCPELEARLIELRATYTERYAGLTPQVPAAFKPRKSGGGAQKSGRRRRRR